MLGELKIHLKYGPYYLSESEYEKVIKKHEKIFYIQFARNLICGEAKDSYKRHSRELRSINWRVKYLKLFTYLVREVVLQFFLWMGIELRRTKNIKETAPEKPTSDLEFKLERPVSFKSTKNLKVEK